MHLSSGHRLKVTHSKQVTKVRNYLTRSHIYWAGRVPCVPGERRSGATACHFLYCLDSSHCFQWHNRVTPRGRVSNVEHNRECNAIPAHNILGFGREHRSTSVEVCPGETKNLGRCGESISADKWSLTSRFSGFGNTISKGGNQ